MITLLTIGLGLQTAALAQRASDEADSGPPDSSTIAPSVVPSEVGFSRDLSRAKALYFSGEMLEAAQLLSDLWSRMQQGEDPGPEARREALTYLCEIRYRQNSLDVAEAVLRWLFARDPNATISPFHHPLEVVTFFRKVQSIVEYERERQTLVQERGPLPLWTYLPLGIPQARQGRTGAAVAYGSAQIAFAAASLGTWLHLRRLERDETRPADLTSEDLARRVRVRTFAVQWPLTAMFYGTWLLSVRDAGRFHRRAETRDQITVLPVGPGASPGLTVVTRFGRGRRALKDRQR